MERSRSLLPLPAGELWNSSEALEPERLERLEVAYAALKGSIAWQHFWSRIARLESRAKLDVLRGMKDTQGYDLTPEVRAAYGMLLQVMSIPAEVERAKRLLASEQEFAEADNLDTTDMSVFSL